MDRERGPCARRIGVVLACGDGAGGAATPVNLWRVANGARVQALPHSEDGMYVAFAPDGRRLVTSGEDGVALVWRLRVR